MTAKPTSVDVAARAGVSQSAVSRVFSGASASPETARKVREAAAALGYRPNVLARSLITGRSRIVGVVVAYMHNQFYPEAIERLSQALDALGYHILLCMVGNEGDMTDVIERMIDHQVDGIVAASVAVDATLARRCAAAGIPVVLFNRGADGGGLTQVTSANRAGGRAAAEFLLAGGHSRIAQITGWRGASTGRDRAEGFRTALRTAGAEPAGEIDGMFSREAAAEAARRLWAEARPDAIFVGNDHMAFGVIDALRDLGLDVPGDVGVVGYDDVGPASWRAYDLTTVRQPARRMVEATVGALMSLIEEPGRGAMQIEIEGPLVVRGSARLPPGATRTAPPAEGRRT